MAFLQLKKDHNKDQPIDVQFGVAPSSVKGELNQFDNKEYSIPSINVGGNFRVRTDSDYEIRTGQTFDFKMSEALYNKISDYQRGELVTIEMKSNPKGGVMWSARPSTGDAQNFNKSKPVKDSDYGYESVKHRDNDRRLDILWGMAFNNATRLVSQLDDTLKQKTQNIAHIMPKMFEIAQGLNSMLDKAQGLDSILDKPEPEDDDVPF